MRERREYWARAGGYESNLAVADPGHLRQPDRPEVEWNQRPRNLLIPGHLIMPHLGMPRLERPCNVLSGRGLVRPQNSATQAATQAYRVKSDTQQTHCVLQTEIRRV